MITKTEPHTHKFKRIKKKVLLSGGVVDILLVDKCECGVEQGVDILERRR